MKLLVGLGNPEKEYEKTRHNIGFAFLDVIRERWSFPEFEKSEKLSAEISKGNFKNSEIILIKPWIFMNLSGIPTKKILNFYKLSPKDLFVIHDDLDIPVGKYKISFNSSSAGHHGVDDIINRLCTKEFTRFRVGIGQEKILRAIDACPMDRHDAVLGEFTPEERKALDSIREDILEEIEKTILL